MSTTLLDVASARARFTALQRRLAFFDGPGGTQCPDEVIDAIANYLRHDNANVGAPYSTSNSKVPATAKKHVRTDRSQPTCERSTHSGDQNWHRKAGTADSPLMGS